MNERGSVSVEFAAVLPLVAAALLLVAHVGLLVGQRLTVQHAAREGARVAAVTNDDERVREAVRAAVAATGGVAVDIEPAERGVGDPVRVTVRMAAAVAPMPWWAREVELRASVEMRTERERMP